MYFLFFFFLFLCSCVFILGRLASPVEPQLFTSISLLYPSEWASICANLISIHNRNQAGHPVFILLLLIRYVSLLNLSHLISPSYLPLPCLLPPPSLSLLFLYLFLLYLILSSSIFMQTDGWIYTYIHERQRFWKTDRQTVISLQIPLLISRFLDICDSLMIFCTVVCFG